MTVEGIAPSTLRQYALLADGERGALVGPRGDIAFLCVPRWHDGAVFSSIVGGAGQYAVTPLADRFVWGGHYEPHSLVWRCRWVTTDGIIESRDALAFPGDPGRLVLLRRIKAVQGPALVEVTLDPRPDFGRASAPLRPTGEVKWSADRSGFHLRWQGAPASCLLEGPAARCRIEVPAGGHHDLVLQISEDPLPREPVDPQRAWDRTESAWRGQHPALRSSLATGDVEHSYAVLRGLTSSSHGMVAAATMALPERAEAARTYDYRDAWIGDECYAGRAAALAAGSPLLSSAVDF